MQIFQMVRIGIVCYLVVGIVECITLDIVTILYRLHREIQSSEFRRAVRIIIGIGILVNTNHLIVQLTLGILAIIYLYKVPIVIGLNRKSNII